MEGLSDRTGQPFRYANQMPEEIEAAIVAARREKPTWGARKIRERLLRRLPHGVKIPAISTIHTVLDRHGLVSHSIRSRTRAQGTALSEGLSPNDLWSTDDRAPNGLFNLSQLSVWWLRLGISIERIKPGHPQQNGRHERMHLTLKTGGPPLCRHQPAPAAGQVMTSSKTSTAIGPMRLWV